MRALCLFLAAGLAPVVPLATRPAVGPRPPGGHRANPSLARLSLSASDGLAAGSAPVRPRLPSARRANPPLARLSLSGSGSLLSVSREWLRRLLLPKGLGGRSRGSDSVEEDPESRTEARAHVPRSPWRSPINVEAPGINGGDPWIGARGTDDDLQNAVDDAMSYVVTAPIIPQWYPSRRWLWLKWEGTILQRVLPREVMYNSLFALAFVFFFSQLPAAPVPVSRSVFRGGAAAAAAAASQTPKLLSLTSTLASVDKVWLLASSLVSFTLSFFLTQSYTFWRTLYVKTRQVQGRLNDFGLLCAAAAERDERGEFTEDARKMLLLLARYVRLFSMLLYGSCTARFAILRTPRGLGELVRRGALTDAERNALLRSSMGHNAVFEWMCTLMNSALRDGRLCGSSTGGNPVALQITLQAKITELRAAYASIEDELTGRMPLAYTQLVQIMADLLIGFTPFALVHSVGGVGAVVGTGLVTLFHSSILSLAKIFLDPLNNDDYSGNVGINVATLQQETNLGSVRWSKSAAWVPEDVMPRDSPSRLATEPIPTAATDRDPAVYAITVAYATPPYATPAERGEVRKATPLDPSDAPAAAAYSAAPIGAPTPADGWVSITKESPSSPEIASGRPATSSALEAHGDEPHPAPPAELATPPALERLQPILVEFLEAGSVPSCLLRADDSHGSVSSVMPASGPPEPEPSGRRWGKDAA